MLSVATALSAVWTVVDLWKAVLKKQHVDSFLCEEWLLLQHLLHRTETTQGQIHFCVCCK